MGLFDIFISEKPKHQIVTGVVLGLFLSPVIYFYLFIDLKNTTVKPPQAWQIKKINAAANNGIINLPEGWELTDIVHHGNTDVIYIKRMGR